MFRKRIVKKFGKYLSLCHMRHAIKARFSNVIVVFLLKFKGTKEKRYLSALVYSNLRKKICIHLCVAVFPHH